MGVKDCNKCLWATRDGGCASWDCEFVLKSEAYDAWRATDGSDKDITNGSLMAWIPVTERLPDPNDDTLKLVNYIDQREDAMDIWIGWHNAENVWYIDGQAHCREYGNEVIAWMPLPKGLPLPKPWKDFEWYMEQHDIVDVVRCEDCAIRYTSCPMVIRSGNVGADKLYTEDDDYCSYGVAKGESDV